MAQTSTSQPHLWKPRYAARQHQEQQQQQQSHKFTRSRSLREPFDAAELTRKLENYRAELKLDKARRELAQKKSTIANVTQSSSATQRARSVPPNKTKSTIDQPERKRSLIYRRHKQQVKEESSTEPSAPYIPRVAARQFATTTTTLSQKKDAYHHHHQVPAPLERQVSSQSVMDTSNKHKLDWSEPVTLNTNLSPPQTEQQSPDAETTQKRMHALHALRNASKARPRPLSCALENMREWNPSLSNAYMAFSPPKPLYEQVQTYSSSSTSEYIHPAHRPNLKLGDRHDWSQASQCGDSARQSLHIFRKKDVLGEDKEEEEAGVAGLKPRVNNARRPTTNPRQKSYETPDRLVHDAVKLIREERRRSILNVFRWH
jgi:hypothetical protein